MNGNNNKNIIGEINTSGNFIERSRTDVGSVVEGNRRKKNSYETEEEFEESNVKEFKAPKSNYETPFSSKLTNYLLIAGVIIVLFIILIIAL